jgi:hypothetical protein
LSFACSGREMTDLGAGLLPAGLGPCGLWAPDDSAPTQPDPSTLNRKLDPTSKNFSYDSSTRQLEQTTGTLQRVAWLLSTEFASSTGLPTEGLDRPRKITSQIVADTQARIRKALRPVIEIDPVVLIISIDVVTGGSRVAGTVTYQDLTTGQIVPVTF